MYGIHDIFREGLEDGHSLSIVPGFVSSFPDERFHLQLGSPFESHVRLQMWDPRSLGEDFLALVTNPETMCALDGALGRLAVDELAVGPVISVVVPGPEV